MKKKTWGNNKICLIDSEGKKEIKEQRTVETSRMITHLNPVTSIIT